MPRRSNESARILRFFAEESLEKAEFAFELVRETMKTRRDAADAKSAGKAERRNPPRKATRAQPATRSRRTQEAQPQEAQRPAVGGAYARTDDVGETEQ